VLQEATSEVTQVATTLRQAAAQLRSEEFSALVIDQALLEAEPAESDLVLQHIGTATPVYVNFAINGIQRVTRELRAALLRRKKEVLVARQAAEEALRNELKGTVTALLLSCEMVLAAPGLPSTVEVKMRAIHELAREVRTRIGISA